MAVQDADSWPAKPASRGGWVSGMGQDEPQKAVEATREPSFLLAKAEKRLLTWLASRVPDRLLPDDFTALGVLAALGACAATSSPNLILSINVYLESFAFGRFSIGYGLIGPTEVRLILIALNTVVALGAGLDFVLVDLRLTVFDAIGLGIAAAMLVLLVSRAVRNLRELAQREPAAPRKARS
jgi:hypothetical protein